MKNSDVSAVIAMLASGILSISAANAQATISSSGAASTTSDGAQAAGGTVGDSLEQIVVTAERLNERQVDVPASITHVSGDAIVGRGIASVLDLGQVAPGVELNVQGGNFQPTIRGIGSELSGIGFPANVAIYLDGFYQPSELTNNMDFIDITSVDILKGPQGTLFGRNATGGAILINTLTPSFTPAGNFKASYGSYNTLDTSGYVTGPIIADDLAGSLVLRYKRGEEGFFRNIYYGEDYGSNWDVAAKGKLLWNATSNLSFLLTEDYSKLSDPGPDSYGAWRGYSIASLVPGAVVGLAPFQLGNERRTPFIATNNSSYLTVKLDLSWATFKSYTGYQDRNVYEVLDLDASSLPIYYSQYLTTERTITQEVNLTSKENQELTWVAGFYYFNDISAYPSYNLSINESPFLDFFDASSKTNSEAAYANATYRIIPNLFLTAGVRYSWDDLTGYYHSLPPSPEQAGGNKWGAFTPRVVLRYQLNDVSNVYASFNKGYKSGVINFQGENLTPVNPEKINAYEVGYKLSKDIWSLDLAGYNYEYTNLQVENIQGGGSGIAVIQNAGKARIYGAEMNAAVQVARGLSVNAGGSYTHGRYTSYPTAQAYGWNPAAGGVTVGTADATGNQLARTPEFQMDVGLSYVHPLADGVFRATGNYSYQSKIYFDANEFVYQPSYGILNARLSWSPPGGQWTFTAWGKNLTDRYYLNGVIENTFAINTTYGNPREVGGEINFKF